MGRVWTQFLLYAVIPVSLAVGLIWRPWWAAIAVVAIFMIQISLQPVSRPAKFATGLLGGLLLGYALFGRSFAYLGLSPVYVGEIVLALALIVCITNGTLWPPLRSKVSWLLLAFASWCALRTIPFVPVYGLDALRDAAIWGYSAFAFISAGLLCRRGSLQRATGYYQRLIPLYLVWICLAGVVRALRPDLVSTIGDRSGTIFQIKPGDAAVHLAGIASFLIAGLHRTPPKGRGPIWLKEWCLWPLWTAGLLLFGSQSRGGLLTMLTTLAVVLILRRRGRWGKLAVVSLCSLALFLLLDLEFDSGAARRVSPQQILVSLSSVTGGGDPAYEGTRQWRLNWWNVILDYTVNGGYFWGGKGFGVNLADEDGFQVDPAHLLRSPHNGHLTILARSGVPGLALWVLLQGSMCIGLVRSYLQARRTAGQEGAANIVWILAYWTAFTVNGAFDVYLEGPQGGIWFWTMFGMGLAVLANGSPRHRTEASQPGPLYSQAPSTRAA